MKTRAVVLEAAGTPRPYAGGGALAVAELELASPGIGELLVRVEAAGICHSDLSVVDGSRPRPLPLALGHEAAGVVEEVGPGVDDVAPGDHVVLTFVPSCGACAECGAGRPAMCGSAAAANAEGRLLAGGRRLSRDGEPVHHHLGVSAFSERVVVARGSAVVVPESVPFEIAALCGCAVLTGVGAVLETAHVRPGESVAVFGLGGVGLSALMGAVLAGAQPVIGVDPIPEKRELALELGADAAFEPAEAELAIRELTGGGARYTIETAGRVDVLESAYRAAGRGGVTVTVGLPDPSRMVTLPAASFVAEGRTLVGSYMGSTVPQRDIPRYLELWAAGRLPVERLNSGSISLEQVADGFDRLADGHVLRQVVRP